MFRIIKFTPGTDWYYPKSIELSEVMASEGKYTDHTSIDFEMGLSRVGGPIIDFPKGIKLPKKLRFAAMLQLSQFCNADPENLLPDSGYLYFFIGGYGDEGQVLYYDVTADDLERHVQEHQDWFWVGCLIDKIYEETETIASRYYVEEDGEIEWDYFSGTEKSKIFGIYTHCQKSDREIIKISKSKNVLLLQLGDDFTCDGVWSVLINQSHLRRKMFHKCKFEWGQS